MRIDFDFLNLEAFLAVMYTGSFQSASGKLGVSKSAVTRRVQKLELALDVQLFVRTTREVKPTLAAKRLRAGQIFINNYGAGGGVELPFGGVGKSGHGREKGFEALYGFSTLKTVAAKHG